MHFTKIALACSLVIFLMGTARAEDGEKLFKANCAVCHTIGKGKLVGPDLRDMDKRHEAGWLLKWIKSSQALVSAGDAKAVELFSANGKMVMPDATINEEEINAVIAFIGKISANPPANTDKPVAVKNVREVQPSVPVTSLVSSLGFAGYILLMMVALLLVVIWVMYLSIKTMAEERKYEG